jgi:hypothetical protein
MMAIQAPRRFVAVCLVSMLVQAVVLAGAILVGVPEGWAVGLAKVGSWSFWGFTLVRNR